MGPLLLVCAGYGVVTLVVMFTCIWGIPRLLPRVFDESAWTVGRQMGMMLITIFCVSIGNFLYSRFQLHAGFSLQSMLLFGGMTIAVSIIPVTVLILYNQLKWQRKYAGEAALMNAHVQEKKQEVPAPLLLPANSIRIPAEQSKDDLTLEAAQLICIEAADNYIRVFYESEATLKQVLIRGTLKGAAESLEKKDHFFRCHRTYLVNLDRVEGISGNAAGYKLRLQLLPMEVPVSRNLHRELSDRLQ